MPNPRGRPRTRRTNCEGCGCHLAAGTGWCALHDGSRVLNLCRPCTEDKWSREDGEQRAQIAFLEALLSLPAHATGISLGDDEVGIGVP